MQSMPEGAHVDVYDGNRLTAPDLIRKETRLPPPPEPTHIENFDDMCTPEKVSGCIETSPKASACVLSGINDCSCLTMAPDVRKCLGSCWLIIEASVCEVSSSRASVSTPKAPLEVPVAPVHSEHDADKSAAATEAPLPLPTIKADGSRGNGPGPSKAETPSGQHHGHGSSGAALLDAEEHSETSPTTRDTQATKERASEQRDKPVDKVITGTACPTVTRAAAEVRRGPSPPPPPAGCHPQFAHNLIEVCFQDSARDGRGLQCLEDKQGYCVCMWASTHLRECMGNCFGLLTRSVCVPHKGVTNRNPGCESPNETKSRAWACLAGTAVDDHSHTNTAEGKDKDTSDSTQQRVPSQLEVCLNHGIPLCTCMVHSHVFKTCMGACWATWWTSIASDVCQSEVHEVSKANPSCCPLRPAPPYYPFPRGKFILGVIYGVLLWGNMKAATPLGAWGRSVFSLEWSKRVPPLVGTHLSGLATFPIFYAICMRNHRIIMENVGALCISPW